MNRSDPSGKIIYFHVGLPKTASTFLQSKVFPRLEGIEYITKHRFPKRHERIARTPHPKVLLSSEMDVGVENRYKRLLKVAEERPDARIILALRRHDTWIRSKYYYYLWKNGTLAFDRFFNFNDTGVFKTSDLQFRDKIERLEELFGTRPFVMFQEELAHDPVALMRDLTAFMGVSIKGGKMGTSPVKRAFSERELKAVLRFNQRIADWPEKPPYLGKLYKNMLGGLTYGVAVAAPLFSGKDTGAALIPPETLRSIREHYREDWAWCLDYARADRTLHLGMGEEGPG